MDEPSIAERVGHVVDDLLGNVTPDDPAIVKPQLDVSRPNIHDNKAEFLTELNAVRNARQALLTALENLYAGDGDTPEKTEMLKRLQAALDEHAVKHAASMKPESITDLLRKNIAETGFYSNSLSALAGLIVTLEERKRDLEDQEQHFWSVPHRPPNYYAREIALRLARLYARRKGKKPTVGTARDGGHPSTQYGRALEKIFEILGIESSVKSAAAWAVDQITEDDLKPAGSGMLDALLNGGRTVRPDKKKIQDLLNRLTKGTKK